ncbi:MAG: polysaccharide deacetylase family protein [Phototrophicaceae bacterium]
MKGKTKLLNQWASRLQVPAMLDQYWGKNRLTVLNYHRIADVNAPDFVGFAPNVSTDAQGFERQMQYVTSHFNVIALDDLVAYILHGTALPDKPLLITFDDGYLDNYEVAFPIMQKYGVPAVIFLLTSRMTDTHYLPWWDACAEAIRRTRKTEVNLPVLGLRQLGDDMQNLAVSSEMIQHLKGVPEADKLSQLAQMVEALAVDLSLEKPLFVNWDQVRNLVAGGVACQPHTQTHAIMTRIAEEQVYEEIRMSKMLIEQETDQQATAFAYPNGTPADFDKTTIRILRELGYKTAFTLLPGPMPLNLVQQYPFQIKRVYLSYKDTFDTFKMKTMGVPALLDKEPFLKEEQ